MLVLFMAAEFSDRIAAGISEYYSLIVFALAGMLFAASANDFAMLFVSIELITITFYVLVSFQRSRLVSLEAGVKYLILGALSSAFLVFGIALIWGTTGKLNFTELAAVAAQFENQQTFSPRRVVRAGRTRIQNRRVSVSNLGAGRLSRRADADDCVSGRRFQGRRICPAAARFVHGRSGVTAHWANLLIVISGITILYGNLCALPQRNLKRLLGYSSISHAGYLLLGVAALSASGQAAVMYYLAGYLFTVLAAFTVICLVMRQTGDGRHFRAGRLEPAFAAAGGDDDAGNGFARGHSAAGGFLREISAAEIRDCAGAGHRAITVITASCSRRWRAW